MSELYIIHYIGKVNFKEEWFNDCNDDEDVCKGTCIINSLIATPHNVFAYADDIVRKDLESSEDICMSLMEKAIYTYDDSNDYCTDDEEDECWDKTDTEMTFDILGFEVFSIKVPENIYNHFVEKYDKREVELDSLLYVTKSYCKRTGERLNIYNHKKEKITYIYTTPFSTYAYQYLEPIIDANKLSYLRFDIDLYKINDLELLYNRMLELERKFGKENIRVLEAKKMREYLIYVKLDRIMHFNDLIKLRQYYLDNPRRIKYDLFIKSIPNIPHIRFTNTLQTQKYNDDGRLSYIAMPITWNRFLEEIKESQEIISLY